DTAAEVREGLAQVVHLIRRRRRLAFDAKTAVERDDIELFWQLPQRVVPTLYRLKGSTRPLPFVEDIVVPPPELPAFLVSLQNVLKKHQVTASLYGHAGHGQLHIRPFLDLSDPEHVRRMQHLASDLYREVLNVGGTVSGEHADGLSRTWFLREQFGPLYRVFEQLKRIFDPQNILNPGKIVDSQGQSLTQNLRPVSPAGQVRDVLSDSSDPDGVLLTASTANPLVQLELNWSQNEIMQAARSCNGCGGCRSQADAERMCPIFRFAPSEEATPRAKANLMRAFLTGHLDASLLKSPAIKDLADLCVNCHQCRIECPANVNIPRLMVECKAQYVTDNGLSTS
ncbi:MAG: 4Fe-4S dicluster domain-containing protein, partial [Planctomycetales bacterium]|nr:4Fe-4S dicluster domain-containing protein [Planctomycetales bacterium]